MVKRDVAALFNGWWDKHEGKDGVMTKDHRFYPIDVVFKALDQMRVTPQLCGTCLEVFFDGPPCPFDGEVTTAHSCCNWKPVTMWHRFKRWLSVLISPCHGTEGCYSRARCRGCKKV